MLEHYLRYKRVSTEKDIFGKGQKRAAIFSGRCAHTLDPRSYATEIRFELVLRIHLKRIRSVNSIWVSFVNAFKTY